MKLEAGMNAPSFTGASMRGTSVSLESFHGKPLLLQFRRFASCLPCNLQLREVIRRHKDFVSAGINLVVFVHSPKASIDKYQIPDIPKDKLPFDIVADPGKQIFKVYGVEPSWKWFLTWDIVPKTLRAISAGLFTTLKIDGGISGLPADILVDENGVVRYAHYGKNLVDIHTVDEILDIANGLCPH